MPSNRTSAATSQPQDGQPSSPASSGTSLSKQQENKTEEAGPSEDSKAATLNEQKTTPTPPLMESKKSPNPNQVQVMQIESAPNGNTEEAPPPLQDVMILEEAVRVTRARSRRTRGGAAAAAAASNR